VSAMREVRNSVLARMKPLLSFTFLYPTLHDHFFSLLNFPFRCQSSKIGPSRSMKEIMVGGYWLMVHA
jgi:hypothetical protein